MSDADPRDLPFPSFAPHPDRDSAPWWSALDAGAFRLQRCGDCGTLRWPPRALCNRCRSFESGWEDVARSGRVASWIRTHQVFAPEAREKVPYVVVQVALDAQADLLLIGGWLAEREPAVGEAVVLEIVDGGHGHALPCWRPRASN
ncbi:MAG: zinc ribbon domain-containing protein [Myxococcota bacterium]